MSRVDFENPGDLSQETGEKAKVAAGDSEDAGDSLLVGDPFLWQLSTGRPPFFL